MSECFGAMRTLVQGEFMEVVMFSNNVASSDARLEKGHHCSSGSEDGTFSARTIW